MNTKTVIFWILLNNSLFFFKSEWRLPSYNQSSSNQDPEPSSTTQNTCNDLGWRDPSQSYNLGWQDSSWSFCRCLFSWERNQSVNSLYYDDDDSSCGPTLEEQMERVNINSVSSILNFCLDGVDNFSSVKNIFLHAVKEVTRDLNWFDVKKHKCALCGGSSHNFDSCSEVNQSDLKNAYICLQLLINKLMANPWKLYLTNKDHHDIRSTSISAINLALVNNVSTESLQELQPDVLHTPTN